jgi:hypothetical protein
MGTLKNKEGDIMKKFKYKRIDTSTMKGLLLAERYHANGWRTIQAGLWTILFEREVKS